VGVDVVVARTHYDPKLPNTLANQVVLKIRVQIIKYGGLVVITAVITETCIIFSFATFTLDTITRSHNLKREIDSFTAKVMKNRGSVSNEGTPNIDGSLEGHQHWNSAWRELLQLQVRQGEESPGGGLRYRRCLDEEALSFEGQAVVGMGMGMGGIGATPLSLGRQPTNPHDWIHPNPNVFCIEK
jgi:hypothetical protein